MCDPPAILVRSACFLRDPDEVHPNFYKRSCASTYPFYNTKGEVALLGAVFTFLSARSLENYLRLRKGISRILPWLLFCTAAVLDSAVVHSPPKEVKCKLKLNSSLTDSVREEFQVQFGSSHFHGPAHTVLFSAVGVSLGWVAGRSGGRAVRLAGQAGGRLVPAGGQAPYALLGVGGSTVQLPAFPQRLVRPIEYFLASVTHLSCKPSRHSSELFNCGASTAGVRKPPT